MYKFYSFINHLALSLILFSFISKINSFQTLLSLDLKTLLISPITNPETKLQR